MMLCDRDIFARAALGDIEIDPWPHDDDSRVQPCTIDLRLSRDFLRPLLLGQNQQIVKYGPGLGTPKIEYSKLSDDSVVVMPNQFILGSTIERIRIGNRHCAEVMGKSTLGRLGLMVHVTAGFIDPGFNGNITLEIVNLAPYPIELFAGCRIAQIGFHELSDVPARLYGHRALGSQYGGIQKGTVPAGGQGG